jgi:DNA-binding CsgD family transcriptional regulator
MRTGRPTREERAEVTAQAEELLALARSESRNGSHERSWRASLDAAALGRSLCDARIVARAATALSGPDILAFRLTPARQALCLEALAMLGDDDAQQRELVAAHLDAISTPWAEPASLDTGARISGEEAERRFAALRAEHARALGPAGTGERLAVAARIIELGSAVPDDEIVIWGRLWRLDALIQLGLRVEFNDELGRFTAVVSRLGSPVWDWRLTCVHACLALLEDRLDDVPPLMDAAERLGAESGLEDAPWMGLVIRSEYATRTGEGLDEVEAEVRRALAGAPVFAHGWRAGLLVSMDRADEAVAIWRALAPHLEEFPLNAVEWVLAMVGFVDLAILDDDDDGARWLLEALQPYAHLHAIGSAAGAYYGPVELALGRLAAFLGDRDSGMRWLRGAERRAEGMLAPWFATQARDALAALDVGDEPLTPRESEVAGLVAEGRSNREIALRLNLSERTVEQHVSSALRKLGLSSRSGLATWSTRRREALRQAMH